MSDHEEHPLIIGNLVPAIYDSDLKDAFEKFGHLVRAKVFKNRWTGKCTGYGFVVFDKESAMEAANLDMKDFQLGGEYITTAIVRPGFGRPGKTPLTGVYRVRSFGIGLEGFGEECFKSGKPRHLPQECGKKASSRYGGRVDSVKPTRYLTDERGTGERYGSSGRRDRSRGDGGSERYGSSGRRDRPRGDGGSERYGSSGRRDRSRGDSGSRRASTYGRCRPSPYDRRRRQLSVC